MEIFETYMQLQHDDFCFAYLDHFSDKATDALIAVQDARSDTQRKIRKKISFLVTECFQNIIRHTENGDKNRNFDKLFAVRSMANQHAILTVNPIRKTNRERLESSLKNLQTLSPEELKKIYLEALVDEGFSDKGGAGLGLIEMARKTKKAPYFEFQSLNNEMDQFTLELNLSDGEDMLFQKNGNLGSGSFFSTLKESRVLLLQKSNFSQEAVMSLFELLTLTQHEQSIHLPHNSLYLVIELLQNVSNHAAVIEDEKPGIFQITLDEEQSPTFHTGNFILNSEAGELELLLDRLKNMDDEQLGKHYKDKLKRDLEGTGEQTTAGIGLIEIYRLTGKKLSHKLTPVDDNLSFISFSAPLQR